MKQLNQWVNWGINKDKPKIPYKPTTLKSAKAGDPSTWSSYFEAMNRVKTGEALGVGFEFHNNGIYGVDLDKVFIDGELTPEATEIVNTLNSYTEISPSSTGLHILVKASDIELKANRKGFIEIYYKERYFTITGNVYGEPKPIQDRTVQLQAVYDKYLKPNPVESPKQQITLNMGIPKTGDTHYKTDEDYLRRTELEKDNNFATLYNGSRGLQRRHTARE